MSKKILSKTLKERTSQHGDLNDHSKVAQALKRAFANSINGGKLPDLHQEAVDMILHKLARIASGNFNHKDHWHDIAGYATLVEDRIK